MSASPLLGKRVRILVSDPWEFGTECGVGPFKAVIADARADAVLLKLELPIAYRGAHLQTVIARPRHAPGTIDPLTSKGCLAANLSFLPLLVTALSQVPNDAKAGMVPAIGSIESTSR